MRNDARALMTIPLVLLLSAGAAPDALADAGDGWSFGVGTGLGVHASDSPSNSGHTELVGDLNLRARFLWMMGVDLRFNLQGADSVAVNDRPQYAARYRTTLLMYAVPTSAISVYFGAGIGATAFSELLSTGAEGSSYHAGLGVEFYIDDTFTVDTSFYVLAPGYKSVERDVERRAALEIDTLSADPSRTAREIPEELPIGDYVSLSNFELMARAMMVF